MTIDDKIEINPLFELYVLNTSSGTTWHDDKTQFVFDTVVIPTRRLIENHLKGF